MRNSATILRIGGAILALTVLAAALVLLLRKPEQKHLTAYFTSSVGLYPGADVRILGIPVGEVTEVQPTGDAVRVKLRYEAKYKVPRDVKAMIVAQTLVSDRFVQLTPVHRKGQPVIADGAPLGTDRTAVPAEVDQVSRSLNDLSTALGPDGANKDGSLSRLLATSADVFQGLGPDVRQTIGDTSTMLSTLSDGRDDIAKSVHNLRVITDTMKANDRQIASFTQNLHGVSAQLAGEKEELSAALNTLGPTMRNVEKFISENKGDLSKSTRELAQITGVLVKQKDALAEVLEVGPLAISNLARAYDPISGTIHTRPDLRMFKDLADWVCSLAYSAGTPAKECLDFMKPYNGIGKALTGLHLDLSWLTALTTHYDPVPLPPDAYPPGEGPNRKNAPRETGKPQDLTALLPGGGK